jgi:hypothetical protein
MKKDLGLWFDVYFLAVTAVYVLWRSVVFLKKIL